MVFPGHAGRCRPLARRHLHEGNPMTDETTAHAWYRRRPLPWHRAGFRRLTTAWVFTNIADGALFLMAAVWVKELTGSDRAAAMVFVMFGVPALLAPLLGHVADRMSRRRLLAFANVAMAPLLAALLAVGDRDDLWVIYVVVFCYGAMTYLTAGAQSGLLRDLLPDDELASGNAVLSAVDQLLRLLAPLAGTGLYVLAGPRVVVTITMTCFVVAGLLLTTVAVDETPPEPTDERLGQSLVAGFRQLAAASPLGAMTLLTGIGFGVAGLVNVAAFPVLEQGLGLQPAMISVLVVFQGLGAVGGGALSAALIRRFGEYTSFVIGFTATGLAMLTLVTGSLPLIIGGLMALGWGVTLTVVAFTTLRQRLTPPRLQGRTAAAMAIAINVPSTAAMVVGAAVVASVDYRLLIGAAVAAILGCAGWAALRRARYDVAPRNTDAVADDGAGDDDGPGGGDGAAAVDPPLAAHH